MQVMIIKKIIKRAVSVIAAFFMIPELTMALTVRDSLTRVADLIIEILPINTVRYAQLWDGFLLFTVIFYPVYSAGKRIGNKMIGIGAGLVLFISMEVYMVTNNIAITGHPATAFLAVIVGTLSLGRVTVDYFGWVAGNR